MEYLEALMQMCLTWSGMLVYLVGLAREQLEHRFRAHAWTGRHTEADKRPTVSNTPL